MELLPAPDPLEPVYSIELPPYDEDARRPALMAELAAMAAPDDPEDFDLDLATDILLDLERWNDGYYGAFDLSVALTRSERMREELKTFIAGWDAAAALTRRFSSARS
ncbi:MAG: hypothetical protein AB4911_18110 [Oscillochloridaceae bacterium umkhey_bin13]